MSAAARPEPATRCALPERRSLSRQGVAREAAAELVAAEPVERQRAREKPPAVREADPQPRLPAVG